VGGQRPRFIAVIGGARCSADALRHAEGVGRELARRGATVVCGGLSGVMEAVCKGVQAEGGISVGILPGTAREDANPYVTIPVVSGMGSMRNAIVIRSAEAVIAIDGGYGTLWEIAHALELGIPVIGLDTWHMSIGGQEDLSVILAEDAQDAVEKALAAAQKRHSSSNLQT